MNPSSVARMRAHFLMAATIASLIVAALWLVLMGSGYADAQENRPGPITITGSETITKGATTGEAFTVTTSNIGALFASYYSVTITESGHLGESRACSGNVYETYRPRAGDNKTHNITLWGCTLGSTTITATLTFQGPDDFESSEIGEATFSTTVVLPPPPAPTVLTIVQHSTYPEWVRITWNRRAGIGHHDIYRRVSGEDNWDDVGTYTITRDRIGFSVSLPECGTTYEFQVGATGDGITYARTETRSRTRSIWRACPLPEISIEADGRSIVEGDAAEFKLTASRAPDDDLTVTIHVKEEGDYIDGSKPTSVTIEGGETFKEFDIGTDSDRDDEEDGKITVEVSEDTRYIVGTPSSVSVIVKDDDPPPPPTGITVERSSTRDRDEVTVDWDDVDDVDEYAVQRREGATGSVVTLTERGDPGDKFGADCDKLTYFRVASIGDKDPPAEGIGDYSSFEQSELCSAPAPSGFGAAAVDEYSIKTTWTALPGGVNYRVQMRRADESWGSAGTGSTAIASSATSYTSTGLICGTRYYFQISARGNGTLYTSGRGSFSTGSVYASTKDCPRVSVSTPEPDEGDEDVENFGVRIFEGDRADFILSLSKAVSQPTTVKAVVIQTGDYVAASELSAPYSTRSFTVPADTTKHMITISTVDDTTGERSGSVTVSLRADTGIWVGSPYQASMIIDDNDLRQPEKPLGVTAATVPNLPTSVRVEWTKHEDVAFYRIQDRVTPDGEWEYGGRNTQQQLRSTTIGSYTSVECGRIYEIRVWPFGNGRTSRAARGPASDIIEYESRDCPLMPAPTNLTVKTDPAPTKYTMALDWEGVDDAASYRVERWEDQGNEDDFDDDWVVADEASDVITGTSHTVTGLTCGEAHQFRVRARGSGHPWRAQPGLPSATVTGSTADCDTVSIALTDPSDRVRVFEGDTVEFTVSVTNGLASATEVNVRVDLEHALINGAEPETISFPANTDSRPLEIRTADYTIGSNPNVRGSITVTLLPGTGYDLGDTGTSATVIVDDEDLGGAPRPTGFTVAAVDDDYTVARVSWTTRSGVPFYQVQRRVGTTGSWDADDSRYAVGEDPRHHVDPDDDPDSSVDYEVVCGTSYQMRVVPYGDGKTYKADSGTATDSVTFTRECPRAPAPANFRVTGTTKHTMGLAWDEIEVEDATYTLERKGSGDPDWVLADDDSDELDATTHTVTGLQCGSGYEFRVSAAGDGHPYSTMDGHYAEFASQQHTSDCPEVSVSLVPTPEPALASVDYDRVFEGDSATFSLTASTEFPDDVTINLSVTKPRYSSDPDVSQTVTTTETVTFPADTRTHTFTLATLENSAEDGRGTLTVTLASGTGYRAKSGVDSVSMTVDDDDLDEAPAPADVRFHVIDGNYTSYRVTWTEHDNVKRYVFHRRAQGAGDDAWKSVGSYTRDLRSLTAYASVTCGIDYEYRVAPVGDGEALLADFGVYSDSVSLNRTCPPAPAPRNLTVLSHTEYTAALTWKSVLNAHAYKIEKSSDGGSNWEAVSDEDDTVAAPATSHTVTDLSCGMTYAFRIKARGDGIPYRETYGDDDFASDVTPAVTTRSCPTLSIAADDATIVEGADAEFTISSNKSVGAPFTVTITTTQVETTSGDAADYILGDVPESFPFPQGVRSVVVSILIDDDTVGEPRASITVALDADTAKYLLGSSMSASVTIDDDDLDRPNPPDDLTISPLADYPTSYRAEWTRADNVADYEVEFRLENAKDWDPFGSYGIRSTIGVSKSLLCGMDYEFRIRALGDGETTRAVWSGYSTTVDYATPDCLTLAAPEDLEADNEVLTSIDLSWSPVTGAIEYKVEYMAETVEDWTALENEVRAPGVGPFDASPNGTVDPTVTVSDLICRTNYSFRVSARGNGRLYDSEYGPVSDVLAASTERSYDSCDDRVPSFGSETINDISIDAGETVTPVVLPEATGGDFPLAYSFDNDTPLPEGLEFDDETRILSGTPTMPLCGSPFIYTVTDADPTDPDSDTISFNIFVLDPDIPRPSFNSATVADWTYSITANSTALQLPRATGEFGTLRYSLEPPLPSGMTFDADRLIIYGVPTSTATAREYTYKVRNNADCANTDSDSITFSLDFADPPAHPQFHVRPSGITASGNDEAGTITLSWNPDDNAGYRFRQWDDNTQRFRDIPRDNFTVTCGGRIATACPPDATSAVISGFTDSGAYYHKIAGRSGSNPDWISSTSFTTVTLTISDPQPTFNNATVSDMVFIEDRAIDPLTLPIAVGGNGQLDYTLTPDLPDGLSFNPLTRTISGTPVEAFPSETYRLVATDSDTTNPDTVSLSFSISVVHDFTPNDPLPLGGESGLWQVPSSISNIYVDVQFSSGSQLDGRGAIRVERVTASGQAVIGSLLIRAVSHSQQLPSSFGSGEHVRISVDLDATTTTDTQVDLTFRSGSSTGPMIARASIIPYNRPPTFTGTPYSFTPLESTALGTVVARVSATDPEGQQITYSFAQQGGYPHFAIDPSTGALTLQEYLDHETVPSHTLQVKAEDPTGNSTDISVAITVGNVAEISIADAGRQFETADLVFPVLIETDAIPSIGLTVCYVLSGSASSVDYSRAGGISAPRLNLAAGAQSATITLDLLNDGIPEAFETAVVTLTGIESDSGCVLSTSISATHSSAKGTIVDVIDPDPIGDNDSETTLISSPESNPNLRFRLDTSAALKTFDGRPFVIEVLARDSTTGGQDFMHEMVSVARAKSRLAPEQSPPSASISFESDLDGFENHGPGYVVFVETDDAESRRKDRFIELVLAKPASLTGVVTYDITFSKPNIALLNSEWDISGGDGTLEVSLNVHNAESGSSDDAKYRIQTGCYLEGFPDDRLGREFPFDRLRGEDSHFLSSGATPKPLDIGILCQGAALQSGTSADRISQLRVELYYDPDGLSESPDGDERVQSIAYPHTGTFEWPFDVTNTLFHSQTAIVGGLQINASGDTEIQDWCTSSFSLQLREMGDTNSNGTPDELIQAISTTAHCTTSTANWYQGGWTSTSKSSAFIHVGNTTWVPTDPSGRSCKAHDYAGTIMMIQDCKRGDQAYAEAVAGGTTWQNLDAGIFRPKVPSSATGSPLIYPELDQFSKGSLEFNIVKARPPKNSDIVQIIGRTSGWASGMVYSVPPIPMLSCPSRSATYLSIECAMEAAYASEDGDSGSPVFIADAEISKDVILVGVHYGFNTASGRRLFIPIDRIYAESLIAGYDWEPVAMRPLPNLSAEQDDVLELSESYIVSTNFDMNDFSTAFNLYYEAALFRSVGDSSEQVEDDDGNKMVVRVKHQEPFASFDVSTLELADRSGSFTVRVRLCPQTGANFVEDTGANMSDEHCGQFGAGTFKITPVPAPLAVSAVVQTGGLGVTWSEVTDADEYQLQSRLGGDEAAWANVSGTASLSTAVIPYSCDGTQTVAIQFRVRARSDVASYVDGWGFWSDPSQSVNFQCGL